MCIEEFFDHRAEHLSDFDDPCHQVGPRRSSLSHCHERLRLRLRLRGCAVRGALLLTSYLGGDAAPVRLLFCFCPV